VHLCPDELNALWTGLPFVEHLVCHARHAWRWLVSRAMRRRHKVALGTETHPGPSVGFQPETMAVLALDAELGRTAPGHVRREAPP